MPIRINPKPKGKKEPEVKSAHEFKFVLDRNSSTEDLLRFAKAHGYGSQGYDFSPSWMSQELQERGH